MGKCECGRLKGYPCWPLRPNTINVTMPSLGQTHLCLTQLDDDLFCRKPLPCHPCLLPKPEILTFKLDSF